MMLTITDLFCGAGGSGLGAAAAGYRLVMAANHWQKAIETHAANFPDTEHDCADISQVNPRRYRTTDVLWASPECTNHSQAKGKRRELAGQADLFGEVLPDEAAERSRATMWDVPRFAEQHPYRAVVVENVVEAAKWVGWRGWLLTMSDLGYDHQLVSLNSMHAQAIAAPRAPQSRDRLYIVFHRRGQRAPDVQPRPAAWCSRCDLDVAAVQAWKPGRTVGRYRAQYVYVCPAGHTVEPYALPAAAAIDWSMPGLRIGDRTKPLSDKTMARIRAGLVKYARPLTFEAHGNTYVRTDPDGTPRYARAWPVDQPTATLTTSETRALVTPPPGAFLTEHTHEYRTRGLDRPMGTLRASGNHVGLVVPVEGRDGKQATPTAAPMRTMTARAETALVVPYYGSTRSAQPADQPMPTMGTVDTAGVAFIAELRGGSSDHRPVTDPLCTVTASGNHHMLVRHNSSRGDGGEMCTPATEPARTITTHGHQSLVSVEPDVDDATFRMLEPHEIQAAMAFHDQYRVLGNRRERVRQLGNGVTPPAAEFLLAAVRDSLDAA